MSRPCKYDRMSPAEFRQALAEIGWPDGARFAKVYGVPLDRVAKWLNGREDIPHAVYVMCELLKLPGTHRVAIRAMLDMARHYETGDLVRESPRYDGFYDDDGKPLV